MLMTMTLSLTFTRRNFSLVLRYYELFVVLKIPFSHRKVIEGENNYCIFFFLFIQINIYARNLFCLISTRVIKLD